MQYSDNFITITYSDEHKKYFICENSPYCAFYGWIKSDNVINYIVRKFAHYTALNKCMLINCLNKLY